VLGVLIFVSLVLCYVAYRYIDWRKCPVPAACRLCGCCRADAQRRSDAFDFGDTAVTLLDNSGRM
jgi:hypothetical protein